MKNALAYFPLFQGPVRGEAEARRRLQQRPDGSSVGERERAVLEGSQVFLLFNVLSSALTVDQNKLECSSLERFPGLSFI